MLGNLNFILETGDGKFFALKGFNSMKTKVLTKKHLTTRFSEEEYKYEYIETGCFASLVIPIILVIQYPFSILPFETSLDVIIIF